MTLSMDDAYALLADPRRLYVLSRFLDEDSGTVEEFAARIGARELETSVEDVPRERKHEARVELVHHHLPRLADHGIVEYDDRSGRVVRAEGFEELRSLVEDAAARIDRPSTATVQ